jgi:hypothetical protein
MKMVWVRGLRSSRQRKKGRKTWGLAGLTGGAGPGKKTKFVAKTGKGRWAKEADYNPLG